MCLCAKSKPKPNPNTDKVTYNQPIATKSKIPRSNLVFGAETYEAAPFSSQNTFVETKRANKYGDDKQDRLSNYAGQVHDAKQSKLLMPKQLLTYQLDAEDGVSKTPIINTFHYSSILNHCFINKTPYQTSGRQMQSGLYGSQEMPYEINNSLRNSKKSSLNDSKLIK